MIRSVFFMIKNATIILCLIFVPPQLQAPGTNLILKNLRLVWMNILTPSSFQIFKEILLLSSLHTPDIFIQVRLPLMLLPPAARSPLIWLLFFRLITTVHPIHLSPPNIKPTPRLWAMSKSIGLHFWICSLILNIPLPPLQMTVNIHLRSNFRFYSAYLKMNLNFCRS